MKKALLAVALLAAVPLTLLADVTKADLIKLAQAGVSDDVVISYVKTNGPVEPLTADDLVELKQSGLSDLVLTSLLLAPSSPAPATTPGETVVVERPAPVYVPPPVVYSPPAVSFVFGAPFVPRRHPVFVRTPRSFGPVFVGAPRPPAATHPRVFPRATPQFRGNAIVSPRATLPRSQGFAGASVHGSPAVSSPRGGHHGGHR
jgi:hypothetical protein